MAVCRRLNGTAGDLAVVLHSHMPYVEGFGTYPFGEEWLFDAVARSHLPVLAVADRLTMTVTPVLADQLEAGGVGERMLEFLRRHRLAAAQRDAAGGEPELRAAAEAEAEHYAEAIARLDELGGEALGAFQEAASAGRVALMASAATHAVLPKLATRAGRRLQLDAGLRSHERRFGARGRRLAAGVRLRAWNRSAAGRARRLVHVPRPEPLRGGPRGVRAAAASGRAGGLHDRLAERRAGLVEFGLPLSARVPRVPQAVGRGEPAVVDLGGPYDPAAARERARADARAFLAAVRERLERYTGETDRRGLCVFAIDTELLGHWWSEGPWWLEEAGGRGRGGGCADADPPRSPGRARSRSSARFTRAAGGRARASRPGTRPGWPIWPGARGGWSSGCSGRWPMRRSAPAAAERAARELLAVQSSDWAFMDHRGRRATTPTGARSPMRRPCSRP